MEIITTKHPGISHEKSVSFRMAIEKMILCGILDEGVHVKIIAYCTVFIMP